jgi:methionyl-tRNA formyltransferase
MNSTPFRFAILLNGVHLYPWQIKVLEELKKTGLAECVLLITRKETPLPKKNFFQKLTQKHLFFEQYKKRKLNTGLYRPTHYPPFDAIEKMDVTTIRSKKNAEQLEAADLEKIRSFHPDFILRFGFGILKGEILTVAKWGIWSFHHGDEQEMRGGPSGFWELVKNKSLQGVILQQLTEKLDAGKIILKRHYSVVKDSYTANVAKLHVHSADMPAQAVRMIAQGLIIPDAWEPVKTNAPIYHYPGNFQFLLFIVKMFFNKLKASYIRIFKQENWVIGYRTEGEYKYIAPQKNEEYFADPFILHHQNNPFIIAEHYSYKTRKGNIVLIQPGLNQVKTLINKSTHLSYPFVFEENGNTYIIPEESNTGKVNLYQWNEAKMELDLVQTLMDQPLVDPSLLYHEGKYYLFAGIKGQLPNEKLFIFYADQLKGPYQSHPCNPVKCTTQGSRMGGGFIKQEGMLLRPGQYSLQHYGEKLVFFQIEKLSPVEYLESFHSEMAPAKNAPFKCGLHNYHKNGNFEVIDLKMMRSGFTALRAQL